MQSRRVLNRHEKHVVAYHEAGHALCGELLPSVDRVHRISIVPRGQALGYTLNLPAEDRYLKTREELLDYMTVLLGGRAAEQIVFGAITTGASDDLKRVADIAHSMVHDYAMGTAGMGRSPDGDVQLSETTLRIRDEERQDLVEEARRAAQRMIVAHRALLDALAHELLEREVLERDVDRPDHGRRAAAGARAGRRTARRRPPRRADRRDRAAPSRACAAGRSAPRYTLRRRCSRASTTSASPSRRSTPALALYRDSFGMTLVHREVVEEQGVEAVLLDVGENHVELLAPLGADTPVGKFLASKGPDCTTSPTRCSDIDATLGALKQAGLRADRRDAAHRHPRLARRLHAPAGDRRRAHRDRATSGGALMATAKQHISIGFHGGQVLGLVLAGVALAFGGGVAVVPWLMALGGLYAVWRVIRLAIHTRTPGNVTELAGTP